MSTDRLALAHVLDIATIRSYIKTNIVTVRAELRSGIATLEHRITLRAISALVVADGIILAALRYLGQGEGIARNRAGLDGANGAGVGTTGLCRPAAVAGLCARAWRESCAGRPRTFPEIA
jgi:hypothetical protein